MNLLPKSSAEFSQQEFWEKFFQKRGRKAFEWYGTYHQLYGILHKYMNPKDNVLVGGCGNSTLSADLYDAGFKSITSVDISETVIDQMNAQYSKSHPGMVFLTMDLLNTSFEPGSFTCFLDKGTLDALMSDGSKESIERAENLFKEIDRVLKIGGRYVCISLLQEHILNTLIKYFHNLGWMIRVCRCEEAEKSEENVSSKKKKSTAERFPFPVFAIICTKFKKMERIVPVVEYAPSEQAIERLSGSEQLIERIKSVQHFATLCHQISQEDKVSQNVFIELMDPKTPTKAPKYTLFIVNRNLKCNNKFAAFVVPQGREMDWLFSTDEGRKQLADNAKFQRLVVIHLGRDHKFDSLETVQNELAGVVSSLQPEDLPPNTQIPFLSLGSDVNQRREIFRGSSDSTGDFVIEEVDEETNGRLVTLRRLIFLSSPNVIQSEAKVIKGKVDLNYLSCQHHLVMAEELQNHLKKVPDPFKRVLVLGLGGGALCSYLHKKIPGLTVEGVEIDPTMLDLAKKYFGFHLSDTLKAHVADGLSFVRNVAASDSKYHCIMVDVDCKDRSLGMSCPPPSFVESTFLSAIKESLTANGIFLLNLVCRDDSKRKEVTELFRECFASVSVKKIKHEVNEILSCLPNQKK